MPYVSAGYVERQRLLADRLHQPRIGARAAGVTGHVEASRIPGGVGAKRVEIRCAALVGHLRPSLLAGQEMTLIAMQDMFAPNWGERREGATG